MNVSGAIYTSNPYVASQIAPRSSVASETGAAASSPKGLSADDIRQLDALKARDREVRAHEQAHLAASGGLAVSGAKFNFQRGPDGVNYAIGGEVSINTSPGRTPEESIRRAQTIRSAAMAPADPSAQDRAVAAQASRMEIEAKAELARDGSSQSTGAASARQARLEQYYTASDAGGPGQWVDVEA